jgi:hypothetical protein
LRSALLLIIDFRLPRHEGVGACHRLLNGGKLENTVAGGRFEGPAACAALADLESELKEIERSMEQVKQGSSEKKNGFFLAIQALDNHFCMG